VEQACDDIGPTGQGALQQLPNILSFLSYPASVEVCICFWRSVCGLLSIPVQLPPLPDTGCFLDLPKFRITALPSNMIALNRMFLVAITMNAITMCPSVTELGKHDPPEELAKGQ
jgi:hypothetical protein